MNIKLILSGKFVTSLASLQAQADKVMPCLTVILNCKVINTGEVLRKSISVMLEICFVHMLALPMPNVNNAIKTTLLDLTNITSIKMLEICFKEGVDTQSAIIGEIIANNEGLEALNLSDNNLQCYTISNISSRIKCLIIAIDQCQ